MRIIIAGGGTGGHLFPGIALAQEIQTQLTKAEILFLCTEKDFDAHQIQRYGFKYHPLPAPKFQWSLKPMINLLKALYLSYGWLKQFRPTVVVGLGGYGALGPLVAAKLLGIPIVLMEQNVLPGKVTQLLSLLADEIYSQWPASRRYFTHLRKVYITGSPLRKEIRCIGRTQACARFGLDPAKKILGIIGGSQGAHALNRFVLDNLSLLRQYTDRISLLHLSGARDYGLVQDAVTHEDIRGHFIPFCDDMAAVYGAVDLVICRAGGITIAELTALGIPMVLVPYPYAAGNHQFLNARAVHKSGGGILVEQGQLSPGMMKYIIEELLLRPDRLAQMAQKSKELGNPNAASLIFQRMIDLVRG